MLEDQETIYVNHAIQDGKSKVHIFYYYLIILQNNFK